MIQELQKIFHSITKSLEILYVLEDAKQCARILVFEDDTVKTELFLKINSMYTLFSEFKVLKQPTGSEFYSDKSIKITKNDARKGYFIAYISKKKEICEKAKDAEEKNNHLLLGNILGYPECCCEFFEKHFNEKNSDLTLDALKNSKGFEFPFYLNIAARHFDISLLSHFPHSLDCKPSIEIAKNNLRIIKKHSEQVSELFSKILHCAVVYTKDEGVFLFRRFEKKGMELIYGDIMDTQKSKLHYLLASNSALEIIDRHSFIVAGEKISGKNYGIMVFI
ncbi:MAG TPA: hypothetical protein VJI97_03790 [Candidatus Nanoarchaeia archaeon]|nr:hypothetical protein [Candidatus Nanoarchaeia archaeon]